MTEPVSPQPGRSRTTEIPAVLRLPIQYWKQSLAVVALLVAATGGYALFGVYQQGQAEKAENELGAILLAKSGAERLSALEALAKTAPEGARAGIALELAKTAQALGDFAKAASAWETVARISPDGMKVVAGLGQAGALSKSGQDAKAVEVLETLQASMPKAFAMIVNQQLAATAEAAGAWSKALNAYERLKAEGNITNSGFIDARIAALKAKANG